MLKTMPRLASWLLLPTLVLVLIFTACGNSTPIAPAIVTFTATDASRALSVKAQQPFLVVLADCGSDGGYQWTAAITSPTLLTQVGSSMRQSSSNLAGAPVTETFRFLALRSGQADLTFNCARSWEAGMARQSVHFVFMIK
jgi:predicted secreted protein